MSKGILLSSLLKSLMWSLYLRILERGLWLNSIDLLVFFSVVSKIFEKLVDHLEIRSFCDFQYDFKSSRSSADLLTVASNKIDRAFSRSEATRAVTLHNKTFGSVWYAALLCNFKLYRSLKLFSFWTFIVISQ